MRSEISLRSRNIFFHVSARDRRWDRFDSLGEKDRVSVRQVEMEENSDAAF